jgi:hypothetical protein
MITTGPFDFDYPLMPKILYKFLRDLPERKVAELHKWLDDEPNAISEMIEVLVVAHPKL